MSFFNKITAVMLLATGWFYHPYNNLYDGWNVPVKIRRWWGNQPDA